jgi:pyruvate dehydrogenase (quinone)
VLVLNNRDLNQVTWEQRVMSGDAKYQASQDLPDVEYARYAELLGLEGIRVKNPQELAGALERALSATKPCVLDIETDPDVPPLPPHITFEQAASYAASILSGDPNTRGMIGRSLSNMFPGLAGKVKD